jgi:pimeloyl-ACP methyl ester carboxylesterase
MKINPIACWQGKTMIKEAPNKAVNHEISIQGARIFVYEQGTGSPVLFLHGSPDSHDMWLPVLPYLGTDKRFIIPDLPGFGQSMLPNSFSLSLDNMADFIRELLAQLEVREPITLVTSDFGGHYGLAFMVKYPHLVRGVAISNTNFFRDYKWHFAAQLYRMPVLGEILLGTSTRSVLRSTLKGISPKMPDSYIDASYDKGFGSARVRKTILRMYRERASSDFAGWDDKLVKILNEKPAIVLWGDKDPFISSAYGDKWGKAQVHHFKDYGHWLPLEATEEYADALLKWMNAI